MGSTPFQLCCWEASMDHETLLVASEGVRNRGRYVSFSAAPSQGLQPALCCPCLVCGWVGGAERMALATHSFQSNEIYLLSQVAQH